MSRPVRILRIIARMNVGGPALQVSGLQRRLDPDEFDSRLLVGTVDEGEADYLDLRAPNVDATRVPGLGRSIRPSDDLRALRAVIAEMRRFAPDIVHTHTAKAGVLGRVAATVAGVPHTVHTFHGHLLRGYFSPAATRAVAMTERTFARRTSRLVAVGSRVRDDLLAAGVGRADQYVVVPPGVSLARIPSRAAARASLGLPSDVVVIVFMARLTRIKRPDRMLDVARRVIAQRDDVIFVVAGEGPELAATETAARDLGPRIRFLGWRPDVEVIHAASDVSLLTSDNEGMPVALIEAHLCGRAAVATRVGSVAEVVRDGVTGRVVDPDAGHLAEALLALIGDPDRLRRLGEAAKEHANREFSLDRLVADSERLYRSLVATGP